MSLARTCTKSFVFGYLIEILPSFVSLVLKVLKHKARCSDLRFLTQKLNGNISKFFVVLFGGYQLLKQRLRPYIPDSRKRTQIASITSSCVSLAFIHPSQRMDIAMFLAVRSADAYVRFHHKQFKIPTLLKQMTPALLFQLSCWQIMYSWFYYPTTLPNQYNKWISKMADMDSSLIRYLRQVKSGEITVGLSGDPTYLMESAQKLGLPPSMGDFRLGPIHLTLVQSGIQGTWDYIRHVWKKGFLSSLRIYVPVHVLSTILFKLKRIKSPKQFVDSVRIALLGAMQSSSFLATFISLCWAPILVYRRLLPSTKDGPLQQNLASFLCGLSIFIEKPSRRKEMALYVFPKALESFATQRVPHWILNLPLLSPLTSFVLFAGSMSYLLSTYELDSDACPRMAHQLFPLFLEK
ncbi:hypothetical protein EDD86DRAFT_199512 [Gorgonomyces haynaldii]|nr:hypothetical protein EDD86DRAFT_199512 [Gorgonomyces haynaldii]